MPSSALRERLGHVFRRPELLTQALTHRSFGAGHNERLEFISDVVLNCVIAAALYERFPDLPEGDLSRVRANLVNRDTLARLGRSLEIGTAIRSVEGELKSGGKTRPSIIADALEASFRATFVDDASQAVLRAIEPVFADELAHL